MDIAIPDKQLMQQGARSTLWQNSPMEHLNLLMPPAMQQCARHPPPIWLADFGDKMPTIETQKQCDLNMPAMPLEHSINSA